MRKVPRLHRCPKKGCFPPTFFDYSNDPVLCPDCGTKSVVSSRKEENDYRDRMEHPASKLALEFLMDGATPQNGYRAIMGDIIDK